MKTLLQKITTLSLIVGLGFGQFGILGVGQTYAYYSDVEEAGDNLFKAGEIDFELNASDFLPEYENISFSQEGILTKEVEILPGESNPFKYAVSTSEISGDLDFCDALSLKVETAGTEMYDGLLSGFLSSATTTLDLWKFDIGIGSPNFQNKICDFDIEFNGSQTRHNLQLGEGYSDIEKEENTVASWGLRINKVYYDVGAEKGSEGENEWVEIYNQTDVSLDISGWEICDNNSCDVIPVSDTIPAEGFAVITASSTTWGLWYVPDEIVKIVLDDGTIGNGLANGSDMLVLKRPDGVIIDQMNWGNPDEGWNNYNENLWNPGIVTVGDGELIGRSPNGYDNGYDTNQISDFKKFGLPEVELIYPVQDNPEAWYWTYDYDIEWSATNPNGDDEDLLIDLFYIKDINKDSVINEGDTTHTIVENTENDGLFNWTVPSDFDGHIWVKIVATGLENPMLNDDMISGRIYDPIPPVYLAPPDEGLVDLETIDTEAPVITILGNNPAYIEIDSTYVDMGATVTDNVNDNLGIAFEGAVDPAVEGFYKITYTSTDQAGNIGTAVRTIIVGDPEIPVEEIVVEVVAEEKVEEIVEKAEEEEVVEELEILETENSGDDVDPISEIEEAKIEGIIDDEIGVVPEDEGAGDDGEEGEEDPEEINLETGFPSEMLDLTATSTLLMRLFAPKHSTSTPIIIPDFADFDFGTTSSTTSFATSSQEIIIVEGETPVVEDEIAEEEIKLEEKIEDTPIPEIVDGDEETKEDEVIEEEIREEEIVADVVEEIATN
ncbi:DUF5011 domain-containing protein [Candidatus Parcubacteria bacterium]|nr:DUF5011 domain-containing protein [Candidatus Parcubacteria bacterium]